MRHSLLTALILAVILASADAADELAPTGLTIVVCDSTNKVLDTVVVPDDKLSRFVKFVLPDGTDEIRVFVLGKRRYKDLYENIYVRGHPDNWKWGGLGFVEVDIHMGLLFGINGNSIGPIKIDEALRASIKEDIDADKPAAITIVKMKGEQDGADKPAAAPESKAESKKKAKPESEVRPQ